MLVTGLAAHAGTVPLESQHKRHRVMVCSVPQDGIQRMEAAIADKAAQAAALRKRLSVEQPRAEVRAASRTESIGASFR